MKTKFTSLLFFILLFVYGSALAQNYVQYGTPFQQVPANSDAIFYQVNIRAFSESGDLQGVINRLDHIKALGVNVVYLMPIHPIGTLNGINSPYAIKDYKAVNPEFGTLNDLRALVDQAHERGMSVILDWVANHTAWDHVWMTNKDWYQQDNLGKIISPNGWLDVAQLNFSNNQMRAAMIDAMKYWVYEANIDGYRCDFADNPPLDFWKQAIDSLRAITTHKLLLFAEGTRSANYTAGFDFNFGMHFYWSSIKPIFATNQAVTTIDASNSTEFINATANQHIIRYLTNHDVNGSEGTVLELYGGLKGSMAAFVVTAYMKGVPMVYNGQEVAFDKRLVFPFTTLNIDWSKNPEVTEEYAKILHFRNSSEAIRRGSLVNYSSSDICAFTKTSGTEKVLVLVNLRNKEVNYTVPSAISNTSWNNAFANESFTLGTSLVLPAYGYKILKTNSSPVVVESVSMNKDSLQMFQGSSKQLYATILPKNASNQNLEWISSDTTLVKVNSMGLVKALKEGSAYILIKTQEAAKTDTCFVSIEFRSVDSILLNPSKIKIGKGSAKQISATIFPDDASNKNIQWKSNDTEIASVSINGEVSALNYGTTYIVASTEDGNITDSCEVTVDSSRVYTVHFYKPGNWEENIKIYYWEVLPSGALPGVTWPGLDMISEGNGWYKYSFLNVTSSNLIFNDGTKQTANLFREKEGWYAGGVWYDTLPEIKGVTGVFLHAAKTFLVKGATQQFTAEVLPENSTNKQVSWASANAAIAKVSASGLVTAVAAGITTITATTQDGNLDASFVVVVTNNNDAYFRIKNRWQQTSYFYDGGDYLNYGSNSNLTDFTYHWAVEEQGDGILQFKNRQTNDYFHTEDLESKVQTSTVATDWESARWILESTGDGWLRIKSAAVPANILHIENLNGFGQYEGAQSSWYSAMWKIEAVPSAVTINNYPDKDESFVIYPNPLSGKVLQVKNRVYDKETLFVINDLTGKEVYRKLISNDESLHVDFSPGIYMLTLKNKDFVKTQKLIIQ